MWHVLLLLVLPAGQEEMPIASVRRLFCSRQLGSSAHLRDLCHCSLAGRWHRNSVLLLSLFHKDWHGFGQLWFKTVPIFMKTEGLP